MIIRTSLQQHYYSYPPISLEWCGKFKEKLQFKIRSNVRTGLLISFPSTHFGSRFVFLSLPPLIFKDFLQTLELKQPPVAFCFILSSTFVCISQSTLCILSFSTAFLNQCKKQITSTSFNTALPTVYVYSERVSLQSIWIPH